MKIDFNDLCQSLSDEKIIELVSELGCDEYIDKPDCIIFKTICHNENPDDASFKLYYYKNSKVFHCYTDCGDSFNILGLFERRYDLLGIRYDFYKDIVLKIAKDYKGGTKSDFSFVYESKYDDYKRNKPIIELPKYNDSLLNCFDDLRPRAWIDEGIIKEILDLYKIKFSIGQNKIIIPHYDYDNNLIGIRGRAFNEEDIEIGKYMPVMIEGKVYSHPLAYNLYGLNLVKDNIKRMGIAIVAEGEKSVLLYGSMFGQENNICVAVCGSNFHRYQLELLVAAGAKKILIAFDKEGGTWKEQNSYYKKLEKICKKFHLYCEMGFIFDNKNLLKLKDSPFDRGKDTFRRLYKEAVWIK